MGIGVLGTLFIAIWYYIDVTYMCSAWSAWLDVCCSVALYACHFMWLVPCALGSSVLVFLTRSESDRVKNTN